LPVGKGWQRRDIGYTTKGSVLKSYKIFYIGKTKYPIYTQMYVRMSCKERKKFRHRARKMHTKQDIKRGHTHKYPQLPLSVLCFVFYYRYSADERRRWTNGSNA
jgi:hypothetical protein